MEIWILNRTTSCLDIEKPAVNFNSALHSRVISFLLQVNYLIVRDKVFSVYFYFIFYKFAVQTNVERFFFHTLQVQVKSHYLWIYRAQSTISNNVSIVLLLRARTYYYYIGTYLLYTRIRNKIFPDGEPIKKKTSDSHVYVLIIYKSIILYYCYNIYLLLSLCFHDLTF